MLDLLFDFKSREDAVVQLKIRSQKAILSRARSRNTTSFGHENQNLGYSQNILNFDRAQSKHRSNPLETYFERSRNIGRAQPNFQTKVLDLLFDFESRESAVVRLKNRGRGVMLS